MTPRTTAAASATTGLLASKSQFVPQDSNLGTQPLYLDRQVADDEP